MKKYNVEFKNQYGNKVLYAGVSANSHIEAKEKVKEAVRKTGLFQVKSITSELITDWNDTDDKLFDHWIDKNLI